MILSTKDANQLENDLNQQMGDFASQPQGATNKSFTADRVIRPNAHAAEFIIHKSSSSDNDGMSKL
jgi:hypothetical protein